MIPLDKTRQKKIHSRSIHTVTYEGASNASDTIIVEGSLRDERFLDSYMLTGEVRPPYVMHHLIIRMELRMALQIPELVIVDVEVEMPTVPRTVCHEIRECLAVIKGKSIAPGFTVLARKLVGRVTGCTHLMELLTAMAPAAFQGAWSAMGRKPIDPEIYARMMAYLQNSCWAWREDGPLLKKKFTATRG